MANEIINILEESLIKFDEAIAQMEQLIRVGSTVGRNVSDLRSQLNVSKIERDKIAKAIKQEKSLQG